MIHMKRLLGRGSTLALAAAFGASVLVPALLTPTQVSAASQPTSRKVTLTSDQLGSNTLDANGNAYSPATGGNGAKTKYTFNFNLSSTGNIGSAAIMFCQTPFIGTTCATPTNMDVSTVTTMSQGGFNAGAFSVDTAYVANANYFAAPNICNGTTPFRQNCILVKRSSAVSETSNTNVTLTFGLGGTGTDYIKNPTTAGTYYARIATFTDTAYGSGTPSNTVDEGAVAFAIVGNGIDITSKVQEQLAFTVSSAASTPTAACNTLGANAGLPLGDSNGVLNTTNQYDARSYWRVYTNASNGTAIQYSGDTLKTVGGLSISPAGSTAIVTTAGTEKFGLGLDSTDTTPAGAGSGYTLSTLNSFGQYGQANGTLGSAGTKFAFETTSITSPVTMVSQTTPGPITCETGAVRYVANVGTTTKPGIYRTSITYIATPTF